MLAAVGYAIARRADRRRRARPPSQPPTALDLPAGGAPSPRSLAELRALAARNRPGKAMIGLGYHGTHTPPVILRNVLENPAWYTAYTPYQPEISQGRLEVLLRFQTMVEDLTGLAVAGASMLDESTAAAEAMALARRASKAPARRAVRDRRRLPPADDRGGAHPGRAARAPSRGRRPRRSGAGALPDGDVFGVLVQYPGAIGPAVGPDRRARRRAGRAAAIAVVAADLLALCVLRSPAELGADVACGTTQRFGVPARLRRPPRRLPRRPRRARAVAARAASSACPSTPTAPPPPASPSRPASSTSAGRRRRRTSAPPRCCSP